MSLHSARTSITSRIPVPQDDVG
ncbi:hypothetical protein KIPB_013687, partial [Kipferlia bialata]